MKHARPPREPGLIRETHKPIRNLLRFVGPVILFTGVALTAIGIYTIVVGDPFQNKGRAALVFVGMPLMFVGGVCSMVGFAGALVRYQASEIAPVGKDTFNYIAHGTQPGIHSLVKTAASALREGLDDQPSAEGVGEVCPACDGWNEPDARFCDQCGSELPMNRPTSIKCGACQTLNDLHAKFCDTCGAPLG